LSILVQAAPAETPPRSLTASTSSLATRDIHFAFGGNAVLRGVNLDVKGGTAACIIGPSGSGKSTLLRCVNRLLEPDRGEVRIGGRSVMGEDPDVLRQRVGMVFQHFNLFPHKSVVANITLGLRKLRGLSREEADATALTQLDRVGLRHKAQVRPDMLSGGQQQRVAIARALVNEPSIILADEPTGNLDSKTTVEIMTIFQQLNSQGITVIMVTHELDVAAFTGRHIIFRDGLVVSDTPHAAQSAATIGEVPGL